jgi:uncharacterized protein (TIGR03437 family)
MNAKPGPLHFTPDGSRAYFVNRTPEIVGFYVLYLRTTERDVKGWYKPNDAPVFDDILIASADRVYGLERNANRLWQLDVGNLSGQVVDIPNVLDAHHVLAAAISTESPSARFLYVIENTLNPPTMKRIDLASQSLHLEATATSGAGQFSFASIPPQTGASQFIKINDNQVIAGGGIGTPIAARVLDPLGRPVFNFPVTFTATNGDIAISIPNQVTNAEGYVETGVAVPLIPGAYQVTLTAGAASTNFALIVPGGGGGLPGGSPLMTIVRGDGQLMREQSTTPFYAPLTVLIVDENGAPREGVPVTFTVASGAGIVSAGAITSADGLASTLFTALGIPNQLGFQTSVILAESEVGTVEFREVVYKLNGDSTGEPFFLNPANVAFPTQWPSQVSVGRGDLIPDFFRVQIKSRYLLQLNAPIPDVKLRLAKEADESQDGPGSCVNDTRSDSNGISHCDLKLSCDLENDTFVRMMIGERIGIKMLLTVGPGTSQNLTYVSGNNQGGTAGQLLPIALAAQITDNCGAPIVNKDVVWTVLSGSATLSQVVSKSTASGAVSARVTLGPTPGPVQIRVAMANADPLIFDLNNNVIISGVQLVSGGGETVLANQPFPTPLVFVVRDNLNNPVGTGYTVTFTTTGSVTLSAVQAQTNALGQVQVSATAGPLAGPVTVRASQAGFSATAQLTVGTPPLPITSASFFNTASFDTTTRAEGMTPCGLATVTGNGLAPNLSGVVSGIGFGSLPLPLELSGVRITVNGVSAPLHAVANLNGVQQVNFQAPCQTALGTATVVITVNGFDTTVTGVKVLAAQPGIFSNVIDGKPYGAVIRLSNSQYISQSNPLVTGESYIMVVTGLGQTTPPAVTNTPGANQIVSLDTIVGVDDAGVPSQPAKYLAGYIGVYTIEFSVPKYAGFAAGAIIKNDVRLAVAWVDKSVNPPVARFGNPSLVPRLVQGP